MKRNRIVINLDPNQPGFRKRKSRAGKVLLILFVLVVLIVAGVAAGGYFWWRHYQSGPAYALAVLADAAQRNDMATVDTIMDYDKIAAGFSGAGTQRLADIASALPVNPVQAVTQLSGPKLKQRVQDEAHKEVLRLTENAKGKPFVLVALAVPWYTQITQDKDTAQAVLKLKDEQIQLTMQRAGDLWRITRVQDDNLAKLLSNAANRNLQR
jgi:hypothetical protein